MLPNLQRFVADRIQFTHNALETLANILPNLKSISFHECCKNGGFELGINPRFDGLADFFQHATELECVYISDSEKLISQNTVLQLPSKLKYLSNASHASLVPHSSNKLRSLQQFCRDWPHFTSLKRSFRELTYLSISMSQVMSTGVGMPNDWGLKGLKALQLLGGGYENFTPTVIMLTNLMHKILCEILVPRRSRHSMACIGAFADVQL